VAFEFKKPYNYVIQITMDRPEPGGLSGATLEEAVSWGKVGEEACKVQVISDTTICLPILVAAVMERIGES
ncbi:MAG: deoxyhypusine synthase family protein, partial [Candidatus Hecatellaceae archaeon]